MSHWVILGCGYTGVRVAHRLLDRGSRVEVTTRRAERAAELRASLGPRATVALLDPAGGLSGLDLANATVLDSVPPGDGAGTLEATIARACATGGARRLVYLSSTGVYGRGDGGWVTEDSPEAPLGERGVRRLAAERQVREQALAAGLSVVALRIAGIYGPGRGVHARLARGDYRIYGAGDALVSRIHVDDLATAILLAGDADELVRDRYNIADDQPTSSREHADGVAALLGVEPPPSVPVSEASPAAMAMLGANRQISNRRAVAELGLVLRYPSWREGAAAAIAATSS